LNEYSINRKGAALARNKELNEKMKEERRQQILAIALHLFATKGLAATRIADIATASGISQGLLYHYYRSKEEIYVELIKGAFERMNGACRWLEAQNATPYEKIKMALEGLLQNLSENENNARYYLLIDQATVSEAIPAKAKQIIQQENMVPYETIKRIILQGQQEGSIKNYDPADLALIFWTSIKGLAINKAVHGKKFKTPDPAILMNMFF